jgi:hypothetical protein
MLANEVLPWESVAGHGPEREPEIAAAVANRESGESSPWYVGSWYCANPSTADYARKLERERAERDAARRAEWEARQAVTGFAPIDESDVQVLEALDGWQLRRAIRADIIATAASLPVRAPIARAA